LAQAGCDVHFLCHRDGAAIREKGLLVESVGRSVLILRAQAYDRVEEMPRCDVAMVALKTTANALLSALLPPVVKPDGAVLVMQNGLDVEAEAAAAVPGVVVVGGLCFLCANKPGPGHVVHVDYGAVKLGWHRGSGEAGAAERALARIAAALGEAHIEVDVLDDLRRARWMKLVWNIPYNGLSVVHRTTTDVLMADPAIRITVEALMREVQAVAAADGYLIEEAFVQKMLDDTVRMKPYKTSMLLDAEVGRRLEIATMYERPLRVAERLGVAVPKLRALWEQLQRLDRGD
jgi:2-dehydropantoate 2-reductase